MTRQISITQAAGAGLTESYPAGSGSLMEFLKSFLNGNAKDFVFRVKLANGDEVVIDSDETNSIPADTVETVRPTPTGLKGG